MRRRFRSFEPAGPGPGLPRSRLEQSTHPLLSPFPSQNSDKPSPVPEDELGEQSESRSEFWSSSPSHLIYATNSSTSLSAPLRTLTTGPSPGRINQNQGPGHLCLRNPVHASSPSLGARSSGTLILIVSVDFPSIPGPIQCWVCRSDRVDVRVAELRRRPSPPRVPGCRCDGAGRRRSPPAGH